MRRIRGDERGQALVLTVIAMTCLLGMAAFVLDVGSWFRADRRLQQVADAAALAGAQALPEDPGRAAALASEYAEKNGGPAADTMTFSKSFVTNDTIRVTFKQAAPGFFANIFGIDSVQVGAKASARAAKPGSARWVAPIVVDEKHPMLQCTPSPCSDDTVLAYHHLKGGGSSGGAGSFGFVNLSGQTGTGASTLGEWIERGFDEYMDLGSYDAVTGNPFSSTHVEDSLNLRMGDELLFPVYRSLTGSGTKAVYEIIGWVGFVVTEVDFHGSNEKIYGHFTRVVWDGIVSETPGGSDFGVRVVNLTE